MAPLHRFDRMMITLNLKRQIKRIDDEPYRSPHYIRNQQALRLIGDVCLRVARHRLVEVASLEEEEAHEEE